MATQRICFFNSNPAWGGGEKWHFQHALLLEKKGFHVIGIANRDSPLARKWADHRLPTYPLHLSNLSFLNLPKVLRVRRILRQHRIEAVILNLSADLKLGGIAAWAGGVKHIIYRRGQALPVRNTAMNRFLFRKVLTHVIANSEEIKQKILTNNRHLVSGKKIHVLYNAIDLDTCPIAPACPLYPKNAGEIVLGNAGRLVSQKGQRYLIELAQRLKLEGVRFKLLIAGEGPLAAELAAYARQLDVGDCILFLGFLSEIKPFMDSIDVFVLTSLHEGSSNIVLEAMAFQKPVVAFDISSNAELVENGRNGYLVDFANVSHMAAKIHTLRRNEGLRKDMGQTGRDHVAQRHSIQGSVAHLIQIMNDAI